MPPKDVRLWTREDYEQSARDYQARQTPENLAEPTPQARQRGITLMSFSVLRSFRSGIELTNELRVQYRVKGHNGRVVPDHFVALTAEPLADMNCFQVPNDAAQVFWAIDYASPTNKRKDFADHRHKFEKELKVPYYLTFDPVSKELHLLRHDGTAYTTVAPGANGRLAVPELEMEVALLEGCVRYWYREQLLRLPDELVAEIRSMREEWAHLRGGDGRAT